MLKHFKPGAQQQAVQRAPPLHAQGAGHAACGPVQGAWSRNVPLGEYANHCLLSGMGLQARHPSRQPQPVHNDMMPLARAPPLCALCVNITMMSLQEAVVIGGLDMQTQAKALAQRPHVVVATPGRLRVCLPACIHRESVAMHETQGCLTWHV